MKPNRILTWAILFLLTFALTACAPEQIAYKTQTQLITAPVGSPTPPPLPTATLAPTAIPLPTATPTPTAIPLASIKQEVAIDLTQKLIFQMWDCFRTRKALVKPEFVEDNPETHLALRYVDYQLAVIAKSTRKTLVSLDPVKVTCGKLEKDEKNGVVHAPLFAEVRFVRKDPSVNGVNIDVGITLKPDGNTVKITRIDLLFGDTYKMLQAAVEREAGTKPVTIEIIDKAVDKAIKEIR